MSNDSLATFTDRREAIALFDHLRGRDPDKPWPLLPILVFVAQGGSGKSTLIEYLRVKRCTLSEQRAALPYARLDFTLPDTPRDLLSILIATRDQLQQYEDGYGKHLTFPRFDLGALVVQSMPTPDNLASFGPQEVRHKLEAGLQLIESLANLGSELGLTVPFMLPVLAGIRLARQSRPVQKALRSFEDKAGWKWYRINGAKLGLGASVGIEDVLRRLAAMSMPGKPERALLIEEVLPAALMTDIVEALVTPDIPLSWGKATNVVLFLDGFEQLQQVSATAATRLLQVLTIEQRKDGQTDPLLLVIGTRSRFPGFTDEGEHPSLDEKTSVQDEHSVQQHIRNLYERWRRQLPGDAGVLRLKDLYLSLTLRDFGQDDARTYLVRFGEQEQTQLLASDALVQTIAKVTHGHPLSLALAAAALVEANARGRVLTPAQFEGEDVSGKVVRGHEEERIRDYLLDLFLRQLEEPERDDLIFCAVPRSLDVGVLRATLQLPSDVEARKRWERYARFTFTTIIENDRLVLHPLVRALLLRQIPPDEQPGSDYYQVHQRLRTYFQQRKTEQGQQKSIDGQAAVEEAYHALALGDPEPAIVLGILVQHTLPTAWELLMEAVEQAPTALIPSNIEHVASSALTQARKDHEMQAGVIALVLYKWLLTTFESDKYQYARIQSNLGLAYTELAGGDRRANLEMAIDCYQNALQVYTCEDFPSEWATIQNDLSIAYSNVQGKDRSDHLRKAITSCEAALKVLTRENHPFEWAMVQNNLGIAYSELRQENWLENLQRAIDCFQAILQDITRETSPFLWAAALNNLGTCYVDLQDGDRQENLEKALACFHTSLEVRTREDFPAEWALTQRNLGNIYSHLPHSESQVNLAKAIDHYQASLEVFTREAFPVAWAETQYNLGLVHRQLENEDHEANLEEAMACFQAALQVFAKEAFPVEWAGAQNGLGLVYLFLPVGNRQENLAKAIAHFHRALEIRTFESLPVDWAVTQVNIGTAYSELSDGDRLIKLNEAIACYKAALQVLAREDYPYEWAGAMVNLGQSYSELLDGDMKINLEKAIECFQAALQVFYSIHMDDDAKQLEEVIEATHDKLRNLKSIRI